jgi:hypothetical protein
MMSQINIGYPTAFVVTFTGVKAITNGKEPWPYYRPEVFLEVLTTTRPFQCDIPSYLLRVYIYS